MNKTWIDILSVDGDACKSVFCPSLSQKGGDVQSILDKTYLQKGAHKTEALEEKTEFLRRPMQCVYSNAFVGAISNYLMFESNHFLDLANQRFFLLKGKIPSFYFLLHN
jgi:hypothetical protein